MRKISLVYTISLSKLNGSEYLNLMLRLQELVEMATATALGLTDAEFKEFTDLAAKLQKRVIFPSASALTRQLDLSDKERDSLITFLFATIANGVNLPLEAQRAAAEALELIARAFSGLQKQPDQQETVQVNGLLELLDTEESKEHLEALGLTNVVAKLKEVNARYAALTTQRTADADNNTPDSISNMRKQMDPLYTAVTMIAQSQNILKPSEATENFISKLNATIEEVNSLYNLRMGITKKGNDRPVIPGTDPEEPENPETPDEGEDDRPVIPEEPDEEDKEPGKDENGDDLPPIE